jgi:hypothetical protein
LTALAEMRSTLPSTINTSGLSARLRDLVHGHRRRPMVVEASTVKTTAIILRSR